MKYLIFEGFIVIAPKPLYSVFAFFYLHSFHQLISLTRYEIRKRILLVFYFSRSVLTFKKEKKTQRTDWRKDQISNNKAEQEHQGRYFHFVFCSLTVILYDVRPNK